MYSCGALAYVMFELLDPLLLYFIRFFPTLKYCEYNIGNGMRVNIHDG